MSTICRASRNRQAGLAAAQVEGHHIAAAGHLVGDDRRLRVVGPAAVDRPAWPWNGRRWRRRPCRRSRSGARTRRSRVSRPFEQHPGVERRQRRAGVAQDVLVGLGHQLGRAQDRAAQHPALAVDVLGGRIDDDVGAQRQAASGRSAWRSTLSTTSLAPAAWAISATAPMAVTSSSGLAGLSTRKPWCWAAPRSSRPPGRWRRRRWSRRRSAAAIPTGSSGRSRTGRGRPPCGRRPRTRPMQRDVHRRHARGGGLAGLGAFQQGQAVLEHLRRGVAEALVDEARLIAGEARSAPLGALVGEALGQEEGLRDLAVLGAPRPPRTARVSISQSRGSSAIAGSFGKIAARLNGSPAGRVKGRFLATLRASRLPDQLATHRVLR